MNGQTTVRVTLVVKGDQRTALEEVNHRLFGPLSSWFLEDAGREPPYEIGSLLWYRIDDGKKTEMESEVSR